MLLAADIGGTNARVGLFTDAAKPVRVELRSYATATMGSFADLVARFTRELGRPLAVTAAGVGIAGPVWNGAARLTNGTWGTTEAEIARACGVQRACLLNDLAALAWGTFAVADASLVTLHAGEADPTGPRAVIAPGTGLGEARVHGSGARIHVLASEAGHADFAARTDLEWRLATALRAHHGRATVEDVLSGPGLLAIHAVTHDGTPCTGSGPGRGPADVSRAGLDGSCAGCAAAVQTFAGALGAEAGNLAIRELATGGLFLGGGVVPTLLPALQGGAFLDAFLDKAPMAALASRIPVRVVLDTEAGLAGAALAAAREA